MYAAMVLGLIASGGGLSLAANYDTAPGATIVLVAIAIFAAMAAGSALHRAGRRRGKSREISALTARELAMARPGTPGDGEPPDVILQP
jgi:zinc transport system permease protein